MKRSLKLIPAAALALCLLTAAGCGEIPEAGKEAPAPSAEAAQTQGAPAEEAKAEPIGYTVYLSAALTAARGGDPGAFCPESCKLLFKEEEGSLNAYSLVRQGEEDEYAELFAGYPAELGTAARERLAEYIDEYAYHGSVSEEGLLGELMGSIELYGWADGTHAVFAYNDGMYREAMAVFRKDNGGAWYELPDANLHMPCLYTGAGFAPDGSVYLCCYDPAQEDTLKLTLMRSTDGGWEDISIELPAAEGKKPEMTEAYPPVFAEGRAAMLVRECYPDGIETLWLISEDGGRSWRAL